MLTLGSLVSRLRTIAAASLILICVLIFPAYGRSIADAKVIPEAEAVHLLRMYFRSQGLDTKKYPLDIDANPDASKKGFYLYDINTTSQGNFVSVFGFYGVNAETGDIWEVIGCKRLESSAIASLQKQIRDASGLSASELERLKNMNPCF